MLFAPRYRRAPNENVLICFCSCLYQVLSHILGVSLLPSRRFYPLYTVPPPSSEGGENALSKTTVMRTKILLVTPLNPLGVTAPLTSKGRRGVRHGHGGFASLGTANRNMRRGSAENREKAAKKPSPPRRGGLFVCNKIICNRGIRRCGDLKRFSTSRGKIPRHSPRFGKRNGRKSFRSREQRPGEAFRP